MNTYRRALNIIEGALGTGVTSDDQLDRVGRRLFREKWAGVVPANKELPLSASRPYGIVNTRPSPGEHWMAIVYVSKHKRLLYDSFGRNALYISSGPAKIAPRGILVENAERDAEQHVQEENCGQRCLAFLCVAAIDGIAAARKI